MSLCLEGLDRGAGVVEEEEEELVVMEAARVMGTWGSVTVDGGNIARDPQS